MSQQAGNAFRVRLHQTLTTPEETQQIMRLDLKTLPRFSNQTGAVQRSGNEHPSAIRFLLAARGMRNPLELVLEIYVKVGKSRRFDPRPAFAALYARSGIVIQQILGSGQKFPIDGR